MAMPRSQYALMDKFLINQNPATDPVLTTTFSGQMLPAISGAILMSVLIMRAITGVEMFVCGKSLPVFVMMRFLATKPGGNHAMGFVPIRNINR